MVFWWECRYVSGGVSCHCFQEVLASLVDEVIGDIVSTGSDKLETQCLVTAQITGVTI